MRLDYQKKFPSQLSYFHFARFKWLIVVVALSSFCIPNDARGEVKCAITFEDCLMKVSYLNQDTNFYLNFFKYERLERDSSATDKLDDKPKVVDREKLNDLFLTGHGITQEIVEFLYCQESENFSTNELTNNSNQIIQTFKRLEHLSMLLSYVSERIDGTNPHNQLVKKKLIHSISLQMKVIGDNTLAWYNYSIIKKEWIKGIQFETSNDLLKPSFIQKNHDMDYTGALKISLTTDVLKLNGPWPVLSYQNLIYGGEVYTPYFKDTNIFTKPDTFNFADRPHACFEYFGFESNAIGKNYRVRWSNQLKIGTIGGRFGYNFQHTLHRDISFSPYPTGWDAQVSFPGRIAVQYNFKAEALLFKKQAYDRALRFRVVPSAFGELALGHFMSYTEFGLNFSTQNFVERNQDNFMSKLRTFESHEKFKKVRAYWNLNFSLRYVIHNTMLEGYGITCTKETAKGSFAKESKYTLTRDSINRVVFFGQLTGGIRLYSFNFFYTYHIKSPEYRTYGQKINLLDLDPPVDPKYDTIDMSKWWHQFGTIGVIYAL